MVYVIAYCKPGSEWCSPRCITQPKSRGIKLTNCFVLPITNLSKKELVFTRGNRFGSATPVCSFVDIDVNDSVFAMWEGEIPEPKVEYWSKLTKDELHRLQELVNEYRDCFSRGPSHVGCTDLIEHHIDTANARPIRRQPYRVSPVERKVIAEQVNEMLEKEIICPSSSPWAFPVVLAKKKNGEWRFCVDYRSLNDVTVTDSYPLPRLDDVIERLAGARYFSSLDLAGGFWQIPIREEDKQKTAFVTPEGLYEFNRMPFGLKNAPPGFQRLMNRLFGQLIWQYLLVHMDDLLVFSKTFEEHLINLKIVFEILRKANLLLQPAKCGFGLHETGYVGYVVNETGILSNPRKIEAVRDFPSDLKALRGFLGLCSYCRRFVNNYSQIAYPLNERRRKNQFGIGQQNVKKVSLPLKNG